MKKDGNTYMYMYGILKDLFDVGLKGRLRDRDFISYGFCGLIFYRKWKK